MANINSLNLGKYHEAYFVCPKGLYDYYNNVASVLEEKKGVKSAVYCYDGDALTDKIKKELKSAANVIFALTTGAVERAARDGSDGLRLAYAYVNAHNTDAISLIAVNGCHVSAVDFPEDMAGFGWFHRKNYFLSKSPSDLAEELYEEFRHNFSYARLERLENLTDHGTEILGDLYARAKTFLIWAMVLSVACPVVFMLSILFGDKLGSFMILPAIGSLLGEAAPFVLLGIATGFGVCFIAMMNDVSRFFNTFKLRSVLVVPVLSGLAVTGGLGYLAYVIFSAFDKLGKSEAGAVYLAVALALICCYALVKCHVIEDIISFNSFIGYRVERRRKDKIFLIVLLVLIAALAFAGLVISLV